MDDLKDFVINEYDKSEKTLFTNYNNLMVITVKLKNGWIVVEHCICMDPDKFDFVKGTKILKEKVLNKLLDIYDPVEVKNPDNLKKLLFKAK